MIEFSSARSGRQTVRRGALVLALLFTLTPAAMAAQQERVFRDAPILDEARNERSRAKAATEAASVTVVVVDTVLTDMAAAVVWRRAKASPKNVIILPQSDADSGADALAGALFALQSSRQEYGDDLPFDIRIVVAHASTQHQNPTVTRDILRQSWEAVRSGAGRIDIAGMGSLRGRILTVGPANQDQSRGGQRPPR